MIELPAFFDKFEDQEKIRQIVEILYKKHGNDPATIQFFKLLDTSPENSIDLEEMWQSLSKIKDKYTDGGLWFAYFYNDVKPSLNTPKQHFIAKNTADKKWESISKAAIKLARLLDDTGHDTNIFNVLNDETVTVFENRIKEIISDYYYLISTALQRPAKEYLISTFIESKFHDSQGVELLVSDFLHQLAEYAVKTSKKEYIDQGKRKDHNRFIIQLSARMFKRHGDSLPSVVSLATSAIFPNAIDGGISDDHVRATLRNITFIDRIQLCLL